MTGSRGVGKTTLLHALFPQPIPGLTSWAEPGKGVFLRENGTAAARLIGRFDPALPGRENKMAPCLQGFSGLGIPALSRCAQGNSSWASIDEIGYLEAQCPEYQAAILALMEKKRLAAVLRKQALPFLEQLKRREDCFLLDLDAPYGNLGCVILASGLGRRFGGNKLLADFRGAPMISHTLTATEGIFSHRVVVTRHREVAALCQEQGVGTVLHDLPHRSDTIRLGLQAVGEVAGCLFCPGDQPLLRRETVEALALSFGDAPDFLWRPAFQGVPGAPVLFPAWAFSELEVLPEGKGGSFVAGRHPDCVRTLPVLEERELWDVDTPEDLRRMEANALPFGEGAGCGKTMSF